LVTLSEVDGKTHTVRKTNTTTLQLSTIMPSICYDNNTVKIGETDELEAWYFHDRGSLLVGKKTEKDFSPVFAVGGTALSFVAERFKERFDAKLNDVGLALADIDKKDKESIITGLNEYGFSNEQIVKITNLEDDTVQNLLQ